MLWEVGLFSTPSDDGNTFSIVSLFVVPNRTNALPSEKKWRLQPSKSCITAHEHSRAERCILSGVPSCHISDFWSLGGICTSEKWAIGACLYGNSTIHTAISAMLLL